MTVYLYPPTSANPDTRAVTSGATLGQVFYATTGDQAINALSWYRYQAGDAAPQHLRLYKTSTQAVLATVVPSDDSAVGWHHTAISPVNLIEGDTYQIEGSYPNGTAVCWHDGIVTADPPLVSEVSRNGNYTDPPSYLGGTDAGSRSYGLSVAAGLNPNAPTTVGNTTTVVDTGLADWLDTVVGTQANSAPLQDHATLATVATNVSAVKDQQAEWAFALGDAAHGYYELMRGLLQTVKDNVDGLPDVIQAIVDAGIDHLDSEIGTILAAIDDILSQLGAQSTDLSGTAGSALGALSARTGFPSAGWTMAADLDFDTEVAFAEPADMYVVSVTEAPPTVAADSFAGLTYYYRLGSWTVMNGDQGSGRAFVEFSPQELHDQGRRMPGCAIRLKPGTLANVQAWLLA